MAWIARNLKKFLLSAVGSVLIALVLAGLLLWFGLPYAGYPGLMERAVIVAVVLSAGAAIAGVVALVRRRRGRRMVDAMGEQAPSQQEADIALLSQQVDERVEALKSSRLGSTGWAKGLYTLPWYLVIGPPAAGKSTLIRESGLHFPYDDQEALRQRGFGGTRNCDWWLSDQAIFLDTAGRYTTEPDDRAEWIAFLELLRQHRPRKPINGVLLTLSLPDLLTADAEGIRRHANIMRDRLDELTQSLRVRFPVYLVLTQADRIEGFEPFFEDLSEDERAQAWGVSLSHAAGESGDRQSAVGTVLGALHRRLCALRLRKVSMQRSLARRIDTFGFPAQFRSASNPLGELLDLLVREDPYREVPHFEGVYLTSGTQGGAPLRRIHGRLQSSFVEDTDEPVEPAGGSTRAYFIKGLLTDAVLPLANLVRPDRRRLLTQRSLKGATLCACGALVAGAIGLYTVAAERDAAMAERGLERVEDAREVLRDDQASERHTMEALDGLHDHWSELRTLRDDPRWRDRLRAGTLDRQLAALEPFMQRLVIDVILDDAATELVAGIGRLNDRWDTLDESGREAVRERYRDTLAAYLMLSSEPERLDPDLAGPRLAAYWAASRDFDLGRSQLRALEDSLILALSGGLPNGAVSDGWMTADEGLVDSARRDLAVRSRAGDLYYRILGEAGNRHDPVGLSELVDGRSREFWDTDEQVSGAFAGNVWDDFFEERIEALLSGQAERDWVTARDEAGEMSRARREEIRESIEALYVEDFVSAWLHFIESVEPGGFGSLRDVASRLDRLSRDDGPLAALYEGIHDHVASHGPSGLAEVSADAAGMEASGRFRHDRRGMELLGLLRENEDHGMPEALSSYAPALESLQEEIEVLSVASDPGEDSAEYAADVIAGDGAGLGVYDAYRETGRILGDVSHDVRVAMQPALVMPLENTWQRVLAESRSHLEDRWQQQVVVRYRSDLQNRFPLSREGSDVATGDFESFFRPDDGVLWEFVEDELDAFVRRSGGAWQGRTWLGQGLGFSPRFLETLSMAEDITDTLFGDEPHLNLAFTVLANSNPDLTDMRLHANGDQLRYRNEPESWHAFEWPGNGDHRGARLAVVSGITGESAELRFRGNWALFRLLAEADSLERESGSEFVGQWELHGDNAVEHRPFELEIRTERRSPVLHWGDLSRFDLPGNMTR
ncbi:type VI secretion system membrane subunit TssM [Aquisalimonas asiatica]|uniref:Type VI secretion system protein ImpL n=1 Tax=Aquisalimonas asiatica TaxID=406100 RepID=A0A1H8UJF6_9GAMM|nr:type VI secretion system membrane subunit TssM [Aquisalimonas asiatica]SEP03093.1 type VI secretion system protein ImpL [Aquisalimonas asiatica]